MIPSYADIILPLAVRGKFTYLIPENLLGSVRSGVKAVVQFGTRNYYTGIVSQVHTNPPGIRNIRPVISVSDPTLTVNEKQLTLWEWMADYYMCTTGEVMKAALPSALLPEGQISSPVTEKYKPKEETFVRLAVSFSENEMNVILDKLAKAPRQAALLTTFLHLSGYGSENKSVQKSILIKESGSGPGSIETLERKGILSLARIEIGRIGGTVQKRESLSILNEKQSCVLGSIRSCFKEKDVVLLHGITSAVRPKFIFSLSMNS